MPAAPPLAEPSLPTEAQSQWAQLLLRFNLQPAAYADASWLPAWAAEASPAVMRELSHALLNEHGLDSACDWWLNDRAARLFLVDLPARTRLATAVGIAAHRDTLRQVVRHAQLSALRSALGDALDTLWLPVAEAIDHAARPLPLHWEAFDAEPLVRELTDEGCRQLLRFFDPHDPVQRPTALRAAFCVPKALSFAPLPPLSRQRAARSADAIVGDLLPRWAPAWTWLF